MIIYDVLAENGHGNLCAICPNQSIRQAARMLMGNNVGALAVTNEEEKLVGVISEHDLVQAVVTYDCDFGEQPVSIVMMEPLVTCDPDEHIDHVLSRMASNEVTYIPVVKGDNFLGIISLLELTQANELLRVQANTDSLTGLANRNYFVDNLVTEIERCNRYGHALSVARIDVDKFEQVIGRFGQDAGDSVLKILAQLFLEEIRNVDVVGRVGESEFAIFFPETDLDGAEVACNRLLDNVRNVRIVIDTHQIDISVSIGLTEFGTKTAYSLNILDRADQLLSTAKTEGGNCIMSDDVLSAASNHEVA